MSSYFKNTKALYGTRGAETNKRVLTFGSTKVTLYQRKDNGSPCWYFKIRLKGERQYYKRSLKTPSFGVAKDLAQDKVIEILAALKNGDRVVSLSLKELFRGYIKHLDDSLRRDEIRPATLKNLSSRLNTAVRFLNEKLPAQMNTKVGSFDGNLFDQYLEWREAEVREKTKSQATLSMIRDELLVIRKAFKWAASRKLAPIRAVPVWTHFKSPEPKRARFTRADYNKVVRILTVWAARPTKDEKTSYYRQMVRHAFLVIANCGLRSGELFGLKNSDLEINYESKEVAIRVRSETTKVRTERKVVLSPISSYRSEDGGEGVNYLIRWISDYQIHKENSHYVFSAFDSGSKVSAQNKTHSGAREPFYDQYKKGFRPELAKAGLQDFDLYHCRHMFITFRLEADQNIYKVARATGTSLVQIERTYSHVLSETASREIQQVRNRADNKSTPDGS